jgi:uncharacterized membrane protein YdjX (TVP38/TMEM64 family)
METADATRPPAASPVASPPWRKLLVLGVIVLAAGVGYVQLRDVLTFPYLASQEAALRSRLREQPLLVYGAAFLVYVAVTGLSLPGASVMTLVCGWVFGFWRGLILVSFASTAGATIAFLVSRYLLREAIQRRFGERLTSFNDALRREGAVYLFMLRLMPAVPFFVINVVMGLTPLRTRTYWWVSQVGMLPGTAVYVYAGASVPNLATFAERGAAGVLSPQLLVAFMLLGLLPLVLKTLVSRFRPTIRSGVNPQP